MKTEKATPESAFASEVIEVLEGVLFARNLADLGEASLPTLERTTGSSGAFLLVDEPAIAPPIASHDLTSATIASIRLAAPDWLEARGADEAAGELALEDGSTFAMIRLDARDRPIGWLGLRKADASTPVRLDPHLARGLGISIERIAERTTSERKLLHLNTYLTVSTMLSKSVDLEELLEIALFCSMEAVAAEAASILLLDEAKENFRFFRVEGAAKPLLGGATFPTTEGVAGRVLRSQEAEIVESAAADEQFYGEIDQETGFRTRNMIAVPLVAGEERVGVLEVLNKSSEGTFTPDERVILESVADEIAFAIRNATLFDYVVNTYCKRRQGQNSCKGCERPLGSWTPCMRYREFLP